MASCAALFSLLPLLIQSVIVHQPCDCPSDAFVTVQGHSAIFRCQDHRAWHVDNWGECVAHGPPCSSGPLLVSSECLHRLLAPGQTGLHNGGTHAIEVGRTTAECALPSALDAIAERCAAAYPNAPIDVMFCESQERSELDPFLGTSAAVEAFTKAIQSAESPSAPDGSSPGVDGISSKDDQLRWVVAALHRAFEACPHCSFSHMAQADPPKKTNGITEYMRTYESFGYRRLALARLRALIGMIAARPPSPIQSTTAPSFTTSSFTAGSSSATADDADAGCPAELQRTQTALREAHAKLAAAEARLASLEAHGCQYAADHATNVVSGTAHIVSVGVEIYTLGVEHRTRAWAEEQGLELKWTTVEYDQRRSDFFGGSLHPGSNRLNMDVANLGLNHTDIVAEASVDILFVYGILYPGNGAVGTAREGTLWRDLLQAARRVLRPSGVMLLHIGSKWLSCIEGRISTGDDCNVYAKLQQILDDARQLGENPVADDDDDDGFFAGFARVHDEAAERLSEAYALKTGDDKHRMGLFVLRKL